MPSSAPPSAPPAPAPPAGRPLFRLPWSAFATLADQVTVSGTSFFTTLFLGRFVGAEELGLYTLGFTLLVLLVCVSESLVSIPYTVYRNRRPAGERPRLAGSVLVHQGVLVAAGTLFLGSVAGLLLLVGMPDLAVVVGMLAGLAPFVSLREFARRYSFAENDPLAALCLDASISVLQIGSLVGLLSLGRLGAVTAHLAAAGACGVAGVVWLLARRHGFEIRSAEVREDACRHWTFGRWVVAAQVIGVIHGYAVHWLLLLTGDDAATGVYAACLTVLLLANPFLFGMGHTLGPRAAQAFGESGVPGVRRVVRRGLALYAAVMGGFCGVVMLVPHGILQALYADRYLGQEAVVRVLAVAVFLGALGMAMDHGLRVLERPDQAFRVSVLSLIVTGVCAACLIPSWGVLGGAIGYLVGSVVGTAGRTLVLLQAERDRSTQDSATGVPT